MGAIGRQATIPHKRAMPMKSTLAATLLASATILASDPALAALNCKKFEAIKPDRATLHLTDCGTVLKNFKKPIVIDSNKKSISYGTSYSNSLAGVCYQGTYLAKLQGKPVTVLTSSAWVGGIETDAEGPYQQVLTQRIISDKGYADDRLYSVNRIYFKKNYETEKVLGGTGRFAKIDIGSSNSAFDYKPSAATSGPLPLSITVTRTKGSLCFTE
jgi:hypothetical protein